MLQEEVYWKEKSRITWLKEGEQNTRFFHLSTLAHRRHSRVHGLKDSTGQWQTEESTLQQMARDFYLQLYSKEDCRPCLPTDWSFPELDSRDVLALNCEVSATEIEAAVFQMGRYKAPGPDGLPPSFFQHFWPIVGPSVTDTLGKAFVTGDLPEGLNEATICLLPKCTSPDSLGLFRPISLCNVLVKVISKVSANRLIPVMTKVTGRDQASFIPSRSTVDNIVVAQEVIHSLSKRRGKKAGFMVKVDLEKAYDRVD